MPRIQYFVAASLDGFIATSGDDLGWLLQFDGFEGGSESYESFMADVGCIVMGGETYAWLMQHEPGKWPYPSTPCYVFTHHEHAAPPGSDITFVRGSVTEFADDFRADAVGRNIWVVGGGNLAAQFAAAGLLDEIILSVIPVAFLRMAMFSSKFRPKYSMRNGESRYRPTSSKNSFKLFSSQTWK